MSQAYLRSFAFHHTFILSFQIVFGDGIELDGITRHLVPCFAHLFTFSFRDQRDRNERCRQLALAAVLDVEKPMMENAIAPDAD